MRKLFRFFLWIFVFYSIQNIEAQVDSFFAVEDFDSESYTETVNGYYQKGIKKIVEDWKSLQIVSTEEAIICKEIKNVNNQLLFCNCALIDKNLVPKFEKYQLLQTNVIKSFLFGTDEPYSVYLEENVRATVQGHKIKGNGFYLINKNGKKLIDKVILEFFTDQEIDLGNGKVAFIAKCRKNQSVLQNSDNLNIADNNEATWDLISEDGEIIFESYQELTDLVYGHLSVKKANGIQFLPKYIAEKETDGSFIIRNTTGKFLIHALEITGLSEKLNKSDPSKAYVAINTHSTAYIVSQYDLNKKLFNADSFKINYPHTERYLVYYEDGKAGLLDFNLNVIIPNSYREIEILNSKNYFLATKKDAGQVIINASNRQLFIPQGIIFEDLSLMEDGRLLLLKDKKFGLCNMEGKTLIPISYDNLKWAYSIENYYFIAEKNSPDKGNALIDLNGKTIVEHGPYEIFLKTGNLDEEDKVILKYFDKTKADKVIELRG
jgi:hypothetical protein